MSGDRNRIGARLRELSQRRKQRRDAIEMERAERLLHTVRMENVRAHERAVNRALAEQASPVRSR